jgi:hypothetical protein
MTANRDPEPPAPAKGDKLPHVIRFFCHLLSPYPKSSGTALPLENRVQPLGAAWSGWNVTTLEADKADTYAGVFFILARATQVAFDPLKAGACTADHIRNNLRFVKENAISDERAVAVIF